MNFSKHLAKYNVTRLFYLTSLENFDSILERGILCKEDAAPYQVHDISDRSVQSRRSEYHSHVPLFFADDTAMLYNCVKKYDNVILLEIMPEATDCEGVLFFDGNAASVATQKYNAPEDLGKLDMDILFSRGPAFFGERKRIRAAEVHIPRVCEASYIKGIYFQQRLSGGWTRIGEIIDNCPQSCKIFVKNSLTEHGI